MPLKSMWLRELIITAATVAVLYPHFMEQMVRKITSREVRKRATPIFPVKYSSRVLGTKQRIKKLPGKTSFSIYPGNIFYSYSS